MATTLRLQPISDKMEMPSAARVAPVWPCLHKLAVAATTLCVALISSYDAALAYGRAVGSRIGALQAHDPNLSVQLTERSRSVLSDISTRRDAIRKNAVAALVAEPLNETALRQLAVISTLERSGLAVAQFAMVERLSRRDLVNEILQIGNAGNAGRIDEALAHYDHALSVHTEALDLLFPVLARAVNENQVRRGLAHYAAREWFARFVGEAIDRGADPRAVVDMMLAARSRMPSAAAEKATAQLLEQLKNTPLYEESRRLAESLPGLDSGALDRFAIEPATSDTRAVPFTWSLSNDANATAEFDHQGRLLISVEANKEAAVASRTTTLRSGSYSLEYRLSYPDLSAKAILTWRAICLAGPSRSPIAIREKSAWADYIANELVIPDGCTAQSWTIVGAAATQLDATVRLDSMSFRQQPLQAQRSRRDSE